jgi:serine/threonine protein kinase
MASTYQHALPAGTRIQSYEVQQVLGIGGFGITYRAYDNTLERRVAIKEYLPSGLAVRTNDGTTVVPKSEGDSQDYRYGLRRFLDEARTLARFNERSIVRVIAYLEAHGTAYFVMDYEEGECLDARLKREVTLSQEEILGILVPILRGLRVVHAQNFLHRDIKPLNIYLRHDGSPVLLDFGAARQALGAQSRAITRMVTPGYAPFEQYLTDGKQGPWSDMYGIGATLYQCAVGVAPIAATERVAAQQDGSPDPVRQIADTLKRKFSAGFVDAMMWLLEPIARDRPQSVDEVLTALEGSGVVPRPPPGMQPGGRRATGESAGPDVDDVNLDAPTPTLPDETLRAIELSLAQHIGPLSKALVRKAATQVQSVEALTEMLSRFIDSGPARTSFLASTRLLSSGGVSGRPPPAAGKDASVTGARHGHKDIDAALIEIAERELVSLLGPVARILIKRTLARAKDTDDFFQTLAQELHDPGQRAAFLRALRRH